MIPKLRLLAMTYDAIQTGVSNVWDDWIAMETTPYLGARQKAAQDARFLRHVGQPHRGGVGHPD
jgi:hypothetical protein